MHGSVVPVQLLSGLLHRELPPDGDLFLVALMNENHDLSLQHVLIGDSPREARAGDCGEFNLDHVEPTRAFGVKSNW
jgi:hypothetical protein